MEITVKLFATLADYLPREHNGVARRYNELPIEVPDGTSVQAVLDRFGVPSSMAHLVLVNGVFVPREARAQRPLQSGDALAAWPPIAGG